MHNENLLILEDIKKYYAPPKTMWRTAKSYVRAVNGVTLRIKEGETIGLVGESGCGKSTFGRCIIRLEEPTAGKIIFNGEDISSIGHRKMKKIRQDMQIIFQDPYSSLNPRKTVDQIIGEPFKIHGNLSRQERKERVKQLMDVVGLHPEQAYRYPHEFSGGQRQRISVARALAVNPKFVIADEPVSALDVSIQAQILNLLVKLQNQYGLTYLFISHNLSVVKHISDRVAVMYLGKIVELAKKQTLYSHPFHPYTEALLSAAPIPNPIKKQEKILLEGDVPSPTHMPPGCSFHPRCRYRQKICSQREVIMEEVEDGHWVACHFPRR